MFNIFSWCEIINVVPLVSFLMFSNTLIKLLKLHKSIPASGSSNIESFEFLTATDAISILFNSPPDSEFVISLSIYSFAQSPTFDSISQAFALFMSFPVDSFNKSNTVIPLNFTGCWNAKPIPSLALSSIEKLFHRYLVFLFLL